MKPKIHPTYEKTLVHCACGETFYTKSTKKEIRVEICSKCHPFFTGRQKLIDSAGRVERFEKRYKAAAEKPVAPATASSSGTSARSARRGGNAPARPKSAKAAAKPGRGVPSTGV